MASFASFLVISCSSWVFFRCSLFICSVQSNASLSWGLASMRKVFSVSFIHPDRLGIVVCAAS